MVFDKLLNKAWLLLSITGGAAMLFLDAFFQRTLEKYR